MNYSAGTDMLLKRLNNNPPLIWEESETGIQFEATEVEVYDALFSLNKCFQVNGCATLENFLYDVGVHTDIINQTEASSCGWSFECYAGYDAPIIEMNVAYRIDGDKVIFIIDWERMPCAGVLDCMGYKDECDMAV